MLERLKSRLTPLITRVKISSHITYVHILHLRSGILIGSHTRLQPKNGKVKSCEEGEFVERKNNAVCFLYYKLERSRAIFLLVCIYIYIYDVFVLCV